MITLKNTFTRMKKVELEQLVIQLSMENQTLKENSTYNQAGNILFSEYIDKWLMQHQKKVRESSYLAYKSQIEKHISPYFKNLQISLNEITPEILEEYYEYKLREGLSANTVCKHHANIHSALNLAKKNKLVINNAADLTDKPKIIRYIGQHLSSEQLNCIYKVFRTSRIYLPVLIAGTMGLRRSEVLGLRWEAINFKERTLVIKHTCVKLIKNNKTELCFSDMVKSKSSMRILPIPDKLFEILKNARLEQLKHQVMLNEKYCKDYLGYVCVDKCGTIIKPDSLTNTFSYWARKNGFAVRLHDLRHSCASILFNSGLSLKDISEWLGHSSIHVTSDIYVHTYFQKKLNISSAINDYICID